MKEIVLSILAFVGFFGMIWYGMNTPEVHYSWSTKQCVKVVYMDGKTDSCDNLPSKFDKVWVE